MSKSNVYKRLDGRYECRVYSHEGSGDRKYRSFYGKTADEAYQKAMSVVNNSAKQYSITDLTVGCLISEWFNAMASRIKVSTAANYQMKARKHILPEFGTVECRDLSSADIYRFIQSKLSDGLSPRYVSDIIVLMKSAFRYGEREYNIKNVLKSIVMPKKGKPEVKMLNDKEQKILMKHSKAASDSTGLGVMLSLFTGLRIGELCGLKWEDVDLSKRILTVRKTIQSVQCFDGRAKTKIIIAEPKSESSKRSIPIPECLIKKLHLARSEDSIFVLSGNEKPIEPRTLQYRFSKLLKNANLPSVHFHSLRHAFATNAIHYISKAPPVIRKGAYLPQRYYRMLPTGAFH